MVIGGVGTILPMAAIRNGSGWPLSLAMFCGFCVGAPLASAFRAHWWLETILAACVWVGAFFALGVTPGVVAVRELAMVYLLPMMVYPPAVVVSGLIRSARRRRGRVQPVVPVSG
jgi:hypothetical protein